MRRHSRDGVRRRRDGVPRRRGRRPRPQRRHRLVRPGAGRGGPSGSASTRTSPRRWCAPPPARRSRSPACCSPGRPTTPTCIVDDASVYREQRAALADNTLSFADFLRTENLVLRADLLRPWANWVTPKEERTRRYDTYFFVGALPGGPARRRRQHRDPTRPAGPPRRRRSTSSPRGAVVPAAADLDAAGLAERPHRRRGAGRGTQDRRRRAPSALSRRRQLGDRVLQQRPLQRGPQPAGAAGLRRGPTMRASSSAIASSASSPRRRHPAGVAAADQRADPADVPRDRAAAAELGERDDIAAVILFGGHEIFSAGDDVARTAHPERAPRPIAADVLRREAVDAVAAIPKPTVAAITGLRAGQRADAWRWPRTGGSAATTSSAGATEILAGLVPGGGGGAAAGPRGRGEQGQGAGVQRALRRRRGGAGARV